MPVTYCPILQLKDAFSSPLIELQDGVFRSTIGDRNIF